MYAEPLSPVWAEVNLNSLANNMREVRRITRRGTLIMAIVKANAYGHGAVHSSKVFLENGGDRLGVARVTEGIELRKTGIDVPILNLGYTPENQYDLLINNDITATIYNYEQAISLNNSAAKKERRQTIHIKIDTGMNRIGFLPDNNSLKAITKISSLPNLNIEGIFTHFATSDQVDKTYTHHQYKKFTWVIGELEKRGVMIPIKHVSNSAAIIDLPEYNLDMIRPGIILYGYRPYREIGLNNIILKPALTLKARLSNVKRVVAGTGIGYGLTFWTQRPSIIGTIPVGYADGLMRGLSNKGWVGIQGMRANIVGRICMDQFMVDLTDHDNVEIGDEVVVFGDDGAQTAEDIADLTGTVRDEVICTISRRVPRVYLKGGKVVEVVDYLKS